MRKSTGITALLALSMGAASAQEKKEKTLALKDLAPAVQKTIQAELKGGEINSIGDSHYLPVLEGRSAV